MVGGVVKGRGLKQLHKMAAKGKEERSLAKSDKKQEREAKLSRYWTLSKTFSFGFLSGLALLPLVRYYQRWRLPKPSKLQSSILPMLRANSEVRGAIGSSLRPGLLSAHSYRGGLTWRLPRTMGQRSILRSLVPLSYQSPSLEALFQVIGEKGAALVTLRTETAASISHDNTNILKTLCVDFKNGERLVVKGNLDEANSEASTVEYHNITKQIKK